VVAAGLTDPQELGVPFGAGPLDRLTAYPNAGRAIPITRSRVGELLPAAGLRWRTQEGRFGARPDPACAAKRGRSSRSPPPRRRAASPSASTSWGRSRPSASPPPACSGPTRAGRGGDAPSRRSTPAAGGRGTAPAPSSRRRGRP
jgi:hypothetical protein